MNSGRQPMGERRIRAAMAIPGRFKPDGCFRTIPVGPELADGKPRPTVNVQTNRRWRRSGGRAS